MTSPRDPLLLKLRRPLIALLHACLLAVAWAGSFSIRLDFSIAEPFRTTMLTTLPVVIAVKLAIFYAFGLFRGWWKYVGLSDLIDITKATLVGTFGVIVTMLVIYGGSLTLPRGETFPRSVFLLDLVFTFLLVGGVSFVVRAYAESYRFTHDADAVKRVLVVGAGRSGMTIVREMRANRALGYEPVGFVDDDPDKRGMRVDGIPVLGTIQDLPALMDQLEVDEVLLAMSTKSGQSIKRIVDACHDRRVVFKTVPSVGDLIDGRISVNRIRDVRIDDLLGREAIATNLARVRSNTEGHVILVTGAAGSIGSELSRQLAILGRCICDIVGAFQFDADRKIIASIPALPG